MGSALRHICAVLFSIAVAAVFTLTGGNAYAHDSVESDRAALVALYYATDGPNWTDNTNWLSNEPLSEWWGIETNDDGRVTTLDFFFGKQLTGPIPVELGQLTQLKYLWLSYNQLTGEIPSELGNLTELRELSLSGNQLTGEIPAWLGQLTQLEGLRLSDNQLTGPIPPELSQLTWLESLDLSRNQLTGEIPPELGQLTQLWYELNLSRNQLTGEIPVELGQLTQLWYLYLSYNQLTGKIPVELGQLTQLKGLSLGSNQLTGEIPAWLGQLTELRELSLSRNQLTGEIPSELGQLTQLLYLSLFNNQLTGKIPVELGQLTELESLRLYGNQLTGEIPSELANLTQLRELSLWSNQLTGTIPPEVAPAQDRAALRWFFVRSGGRNWTNKTNWLRRVKGTLLSEYEPISEWYGVTTDAQGRVTSLSLSANGLKGTIGPELGALTRLTVLHLNDNQLTGTIPVELANLTQLQAFDIRNTGLCVAADSELHTWIATIQDFQGTTTCQLALDFAHFANGLGIVSDFVLVNVGSGPDRPAIYFYDKEGHPIAAESVVDITGDLAVQEDGGLTVLTEMEPLGVLTISTHGQGALVSGSVKVASNGPIGGVLRFNLPGVGVAGVGASQPTRDAIFPARRQAGGINTAAAIHNIEAEAVVVSCRLMSAATVLEVAEIPLMANGQTAQFIEQIFTLTDTSNFVGSVRCSSPGRFTGIAVELDAANRIFTTLPVVPVPERMSQE